MPGQTPGSSNSQTPQNPTSTTNPAYQPLQQNGLAPRPQHPYLQQPNGMQQPNPAQNPTSQPQTGRAQQQMTPLTLQSSTPQQGMQQPLAGGVQYSGLQSLPQQSLALQMGVGNQHPGMQGLARVPMGGMAHPGTPGDGSGGIARPSSHLQVNLATAELQETLLGPSVPLLSKQELKS